MPVHFTILFFSLIINYFAYHNGRRNSFFIALTFLAIFIYLAIRYDYGTDYLNYYAIFEGYKDYGKESEVLFWHFMRIFNSYEVFIFFHTAIVVSVLYFFLKKNIESQYYVIFILIFMLHPGMIYTYIAALRSALAAAVFILVAQFFYIRKKRIDCFIIGILLASLFHTSAILLIIIPIFEYCISRLSVPVMLIIYCIVFGASAFLLTDLISYALTIFDIFSGYGYYMDEGYIETASFSTILFRALYLFPIYFMLKIYYQRKDCPIEMKRIFSIAFFYFFILFLGGDFQNRYSVTLLPYAIASICYSLRVNSSYINKILIVLPFIFITCYLNYNMYKVYFENPLIQGNFLNYKTIFSIQ